MAKSNFVVRGGLDMSNFTKGLNKTQERLNSFSSSINKMTRRISTALGGIAIGSFVKESVKAAMSVEGSIAQINRTMGNSAEIYNNWAKSQAKSLGMARSEAYKYGAVYSNLISGFTKDTTETEKYTEQLMQASAVIASSTGRTIDDVSERIRSGLLGNTEAIEDVGIYAQVAMLKTTDAFKKIANGRTWDQLGYYEQQQIRILSILEQASIKYGNTLADITATRQMKFTASLKNIQLNLGNAFLPIYNAILPALTAMANKLEAVTSTIASFMEALFGKSSAKSTSTATSSVDNLTSATEDYTSAAKDAEKAQDNLMGFDQINKLSDTDSSGGTSSGGNTGGAVTTDTSAIDDSAESVNRFTKIAEKFKEAIQPTIDALKRLKKALEPLGNFVAQGLMDFWNKFLKPVGKWTLGEGLPDLIDALADLLSKIKWSKLSAAFKDFFEALGKFSISIGKGIVAFVQSLLKVLTPVLSALVDALAAAFSILAKALKAIPSSVVEALGGALAGMATSILLFNGITGAITKLLGFVDKIKAMIQLADPVYLVVAAIGALVGAMMTLNQIGENKEIEKYGDTLSNLKKQADDAYNSMKEATKASKEYVSDAGEAEYSLAKKLSDQYYELAGKTNLSNAEKETMKSIAKQLIDLIPGLSQYYNTETGLIDATKVSTDELIKSMLTQYKLEASKEQYIELYKKQTEESKKLEQAQKNVTAALKDVNKKQAEQDKALANGGGSYDIYATKTANARRTLNELVDDMNKHQSAYDGYGQQMGVLTGKMKGLEDEISGTGEAADNTDFSGMTEKLRQSVNDSVKVSATGGKDIVDGLNAGVSNNTSSSKGVFSDWFKSIRDWWNKLWDKHSPSKVMMSDAKDIVDGFNNGVSGNEGNSKSFMSSWAEKVKSWFTGDANTNFFSGHASSIITGFNNGVNGSQVGSYSPITNWANNVKSWFSGNATSGYFSGQGSNVIGGFNSGIHGNQGSSAGYMSSWASNVRNWFSSNATYGSFSGYGANIVNGLNAGISGNGATSNSFVTNWANSIKNWFMNAFKMHSPSKIFAGFGGYFVEGLNNGISDNISSTVSTLKDWGNEITKWADGISIKPIQLSAETSLTDREYISTDYTSNEVGNSRITQLTDDLINKMGNGNIGVNVYLQGDADGVFKMVRAEAIKFTNSRRESPWPI